MLNREETVVAATTNIQKINKLFDNQVESVFLDFTNKNTYDKALESVDRVFLMRPQHLGRPEDLYPFIIRLKNILKNYRLLMLMYVLAFP